MEVLSGFINGLFLVVIGCFVFTAAIGRLLDPPDINTDKLMVRESCSVSPFFVFSNPFKIL